MPNDNFGAAAICPYVLILYGWDEINVSVSEGLNVRVERMLEQLRNTYLRRDGPPIRIILTGRPSTAVTESSFLQENTPILTIRPLNPEQLLGYVTNIKAVLELLLLRSVQLVVRSSAGFSAVRVSLENCTPRRSLDPRSASRA